MVAKRPMSRPERDPRPPAGDVMMGAAEPAVEECDRGTHRLSASSLFALVYAELREIAAMRLVLERPGHTLQPTALVHEAFLRLGASTARQFIDRMHFLATASTAMRHVLVDYARARLTEKRNGGLRVPLDDRLLVSFDQRIEDVLSVHEALSALEAHDAELVRIVEMRFFAGLTECEIAALLGCSDRVIRKRWSFARAWLLRALDATDPNADWRNRSPSRPAV